MRIVAEELFQDEVSNRGPGTPQLRVFALSVLQTANPLDYPAPLEVSGRSILFDPAGAQLNVELLAAIDNFEIDVDNFTSILPSTTYNFAPAGFTRLFLRTIAQYVNASATRAYIGRLIVSPTLAVDGVGSSAAVPAIVRPAPKVLNFLTAYNNNRTGTTQWNSGGGTGMFTNVLLVNLIATATSPTCGCRVTVKNIGAGEIYAALTLALTNPATDFFNTYPIAPGERERFDIVHTPNTRFAPNGGNPQILALYSGDANAAAACALEFYR